MVKQHKGWIILGLSILTGLACLGFGRFSYGAILPFMKDGLQLNYKETGLVASAIFFGYVLSAFSVGHVVKIFSAKKVIIFSLLLIVLSMIGTALSVGFVTAYIASFFIGIGSGGANVASMGVVAAWFAPNRRGMALGAVNAGNGLGIVFSGVAVPIIVTSFNSGWRISWVLLATLVLVIALINFFILTNRPKDEGLEPIGDSKREVEQKKVSGRVQSISVYRHPLLWIVGIVYMLWGFSYIIFTTFLVDYFIEDVGLSEHFAGQIFALAGLISIISGFVWGSISDRLGRMATLATVFFVQMAMLISFSLSTSSIFLVIQTAIYALTLWAVPAIIIASISDFVDQIQVPVAIGFLTLFFGTGQLFGPIIIGYTVDISGTYFVAFLLSAVACFTGCLGCSKLHFHLNKKRVHHTKTEINT